LHIKRLIDLKIVGATFGIRWGTIAPWPPPLATRQVCVGIGVFRFKRWLNFPFN